MSLALPRAQEALDKAGLLSFFTPESLQALTQFTDRMLQINNDLNLTKWTQEEDVLSFHWLDSAFAIPHLKPLILPSHRWMDLGTGCGFPGAVLKAAFPQIQVTLMDSVAKKIKALQECLQEAGWGQQTLCARAEELGRDPQARETWDGVVARAVGDFRTVLEYGTPLLKTGGYLVNWVTEEQLQIVDRSENALKLLQCKIVKKADYSLSGLAQKRWLIFVEKFGKTPPTYPRPVGQPSKKPL